MMAASPQPSPQHCLLSTIHSHPKFPASTGTLSLGLPRGPRAQPARCTSSLGWYLHRLGCYNKILQARSIINNRHLLLIFLESGSPRSRHQHGQILVRMLFLVHTECLVAVTSHVGGVRELPAVSFNRAPTPSWGPHPHDPISSQRPHPLAPFHWG